MSNPSPAPLPLRRVAVTGGSGELGTLVLRRLCAERGAPEIISLDVRPPAVACARLRAVTIDVRDPEIGRHLEGCDAVVHLAFVVVGWRPRAEFDDINVRGSANVLRAALAAGVRRIVYSSSVAAYGVVPGHPSPIVEDTPRRRQVDFPYACAKYDVEHLLDELEPAHPDVAIARLRPGILVGAYMDHALGRALRAGFFPGGNGAPPPLVWDEDVADAVMLALRRGARGAYNLVADDPLPPAELARAAGLRTFTIPRPIARGVATATELLTHVGLRPATDPRWLTLGGVELRYSSEKARRELGWKPRAATSTAVVVRHVETVPRRLDPRVRAFLAAVALAGRRPRNVPPEAQRMLFRVHLALTGPRGGDVTLAFDHGRLRVSGGVPRPPDATVTLRSDVLVDLLAGRIDFTTAGMTGKVRVEGEALGHMLVQAVITTFRAAARSDGPLGFIPRQLARWLAQTPPSKEPAR